MLFFFNIIIKNTNTIYEDYYKRLLEDAKISNTILFLPNENIKTFISVLLAKDMGQSLTKFVSITV